MAHKWKGISGESVEDVEHYVDYVCTLLNIMLFLYQRKLRPLTVIIV